MSLILNIDTALERSSICLAENGSPVQLLIQQDRKDQAAWLHASVDSLLKKNKLKPANIEAVAVSIGPGSYTGLRVGLAAAKGLCYALDIPLIAIGTLKMMALAARDEATDLICPLIDARRMEVFAAIYDSSLWEKFSPHAMLIDENSFAVLLATHEIIFCGTGINKLRPLIKNTNARFTEIAGNASHLGVLSAESFQQQAFADLAYTAPMYIKEFYSGTASRIN